LFPCILLDSKTSIHQRVTYIAFPEQAWNSGPNFTPVPLFTVEMESLVPVLTSWLPQKILYWFFKIHTPIFSSWSISYQNI